MSEARASCAALRDVAAVVIGHARARARARGSPRSGEGGAQDDLAVRHLQACGREPDRTAPPVRTSCVGLLPMRNDLRGTAAGQDAEIGMAADDRDAARGRFAGSGSRSCSFLSSTMPSSASRWATAAVGLHVDCHMFLTGWSKSPLANMLRRMRWTMSCSRASGTVPRRSPAPAPRRRNPLCRTRARIPGRGRSFAASTVECTPPQSDRTKPL